MSNNRQQDSINRRNDTSQTISVSLAIVAIVLVSVSLRPGIISSGPLLPFIQPEFNLSHTTASLLVTIPDFLMGILALTTPWLAYRYGRNEVILVSLILLSVSMAARAFSPGTSTLLMTTVGVGIGIAIAGTLMGGFVKENFPKQEALLMGIYSGALSLGTMIAAGATGPIAANFSGGWRLATGFWAIPGLLAVIVWLIVMVKGPKTNRKARNKSSMSRPKMPFKSPLAWLIAVFFGFMNFLFYALASWTAPMYQEQGHSAESAGLIFLTFTVIFMISTIFFGAVSKSRDRRGWLALTAVLSVVGLLPIALWPDFVPFLWMSVAAFGLGGAFTLSMTLPLDNTSTVEESNAWNGFMMMIGYLIAATGPFLVGFIRDMSGSFGVAFGMLVGVACLLFIITPFLKPRVQQES